MQVGSAGQYTQDPNVLRGEIHRLLDEQEQRELNPSLVISPHGPLHLSGPVAAATYQAIDLSRFRNVVVLGAKERNVGPDLAVTDEPFDTVLGTVPVDDLFIEELVLKSKFKRSQAAFKPETSIEMQLIFLQYIMDDLNLVPLLIDDSISDDQHQKVVSSLKTALKPSDLLIVSTNLARRETTSSTSADELHDEVVQNDRKLSSTIRSKAVNKIPQSGKTSNIVGWRPLMAGIETLDESATFHIVKHRTSFNADPDVSDVIGYLGGCFTP
jgi:AmmeMemoRadiSam system protein B